MAADAKKTLLHAWHVQNGAHMAQFGRYDMPLWYPSGAKKEHLAVLTDAGLFDTSHMSIVAVRGAEARDLLQACFSKNLAACVGKEQKPLSSGKSVYGVFLSPAGEVIDDRRRAVGRAVIDDDDLDAAVGLHQDALDRLRDEPFAVVDGDDAADQRVDHAGQASSASALTAAGIEGR